MGKIRLAAERGKRPGRGKTWKKKGKPRKKKQKRKPRKKKQSRQHPRKSLKFDPSCECGVSNVKVRRKNGKLWVTVSSKVSAGPVIQSRWQLVYLPG